MKPTRCTLLLSVFILTSLHLSGNYLHETCREVEINILRSIYIYIYIKKHNFVTILKPSVYLLGVFTIVKLPIGYVKSVCLSTCPTGWASMTFDSGDF